MEDPPGTGLQAAPFRWMTIGRELRHIEKEELDDVKNFFFKHYTPSNAILVVAGNVYVDQVRMLAEKWFGGIAPGVRYERNLPEEPKQVEERRMEVKAKVPLDAFYKTWHMSARMDPRYYAADLITDMLGGGGSSRLYE